MAGNSSNIFFSPWSISNAFAIAYEGARGKTAEEMETVFHFPIDEDVRQLSFMEVNRGLNEKGANHTLHSANALWIQRDFRISQEYVDKAAQYYDSEVANVDFASPQAVATINDWVDSKTNGTIKELFPSDSMNPYRKLAITNAIYFKGMWLHPFDKSNTSEEDFKVSDNSTAKVQMMKSDEMQTLNYTETGGAQILEMPYQGGKISMLILLPNASSMESLERSLSLENLTRWRSNMTEELVSDIHIPRFKLETNYDLTGQLGEMGMPSAFMSEAADFSGIAEGLSVETAVHKAFVDVNEEGTEASAATGVTMATSAPAPPVYQFIADHPFIFIIQENVTGNILFMGKIVEPSAQ